MTIELTCRLRTCLVGLENTPGRSSLDIEWLRLRCDDTLAFTGEMERDSLRQLALDASQFVSELPGVLPPDLEDAITSSRA